MAKKQPAFMFYPGDWMKDPELRVCSHFARGLLVDLLCAMWEAKVRGRLCCADGVTPWTDQQVVGLSCGGSEHEKLAALGELVRHGVLKRDDNGVLYSSRIVRDAEISAVRAESGSKGGSKTQAKLQANCQANVEQKTEDENEDEEEYVIDEEEGSPREKPEPRGFDEFWACYPRKVGKGSARKAFVKATRLVALEAILEATAALSARVSAVHCDAEFIPHAATWLNRCGWEDDLASAFPERQRNGTHGPKKRFKERAPNEEFF